MTLWTTHTFENGVALMSGEPLTACVIPFYWSIDIYNEDRTNVYETTIQALRKQIECIEAEHAKDRDSWIERMEEVSTPEGHGRAGPDVSIDYRGHVVIRPEEV